MRLSVIVPVLNEAAGIADLLDHLGRGLASQDEVLVVDGGSSDGTADLAAACGVPVLTSAKGRGKQLNAGAAFASGDVLLFVHADTMLPSGFRASIAECLVDSGVGWGRFDLRFDEGGPLLRAIAWLISRRSRMTGGATGDQAIFIRRQVFDDLHGFLEPELFEDVDLCRRLRGVCGMGIPTGFVVTSSRRWRQGGVWRTTFLMWGMKTAYLLGVPSAHLVRFYRNVR